MDLLKSLASLLPEDTEDKAGFGPFEIPDSCAWMESIFRDYHDLYYTIGPKIGMRLSEIDARVFMGLVIKANTVEDWMERCQRYKDICLYWRIMRSAGHVLYGRHRTAAEKKLPPL